MIALAILSFLSATWVFVLALFNTSIDPDKTINNKGEKVKLEPEQKRVRFMWFGLAILLPLVFSLIYVILFCAGVHP